MSARDTHRLWSAPPGCCHVTTFEANDGRRCTAPACVDRRVDTGLDTLLAGTTHNTGERVACFLILTFTVAMLLLALVHGQHRQQAACERAATTATPCGTQVTP